MIKVGVMRGGVSLEYPISIQTGGAVLSALREKLSDKYKPVDILIDTEGALHVNGRPVTAEKLRESVDVIWNGLHGLYGEDGKIQQLLESLGVPYTGSGPLASALSMHKINTKQAIQHLGIKTPSHFMVAHYNEVFDGSREEYANRKSREVYEKMSPPWVLKPVSGGSSIATFLARTIHELYDAFLNLSQLSDDILIEEYIEGREATVGIIDRFRNDRHYAFLPIEIVKPKGIWDYEGKYSGETQEISPGRFTHEERKQLEDLARAVHAALDLRHYSRSDFIIHPKRGIYFLEVNALPGLTSESLFPKMITSVGSSFPEFVDHVLTLAIKGK